MVLTFIPRDSYFSNMALLNQHWFEARVRHVKQRHLIIQSYPNFVKSPMKLRFGYVITSNRHCVMSLFIHAAFSHYSDAIMTTMASQITSLPIVFSTVYSDANQRNIKAPRHWHLCGEFTGTGEFPAQRASYAENISIWWRHHEINHTS